MGMPLTSHRFTVDEFQRMGEAGILHEDARVELLDGEILEMSPIGPRHAACVRYLETTFHRQPGGRALVSGQSPMVAGRFWQPQPDVCLLAPRPDFYRAAHPEANDVLLVIEVADTSLQIDRGRKVPAYARAAIGEAWLVNLPGEVVEIYRQPRDGRYGDVRTARRGETIAPLAFPHVILPVDDILG